MRKITNEIRREAERMVEKLELTKHSFWGIEERNGEWVLAVDYDGSEDYYYYTIKEVC